MTKKLKVFLNEQADSFKTEITEGDYKIELRAEKRNMESNYHAKFVSVRIYKNDDPICSVVMYPGRYDNFIEVSRRKKKGQYIDIGRTGSNILNILNQEVEDNIRIFDRFDKSTFNQLESRLAYQIYKNNSRKYKSLTRLEIFEKTVEEVNKISSYNIKPTYIESFLSEFYPELRTFNRFGFYYKMLKGSGKSSYELKRIFDRKKNNPVSYIRDNYFSSYSYAEVWDLLHTLGVVSISNLMKKK